MAIVDEPNEDKTVFSVNHLGQTCTYGSGDACNISVVVPVFNERGNLEALIDQLESVLTTMNMAFEIICVDDGSTDDSLSLLESMSRERNYLTVIVFRRNYGQTAAMAAGFKYASGDIVVALDADLQNDPRDIPKLVDRIHAGADVVSGWRKDRKDDTLKRKFPSIVANWVINWLISGTGVHLHDYGCTLKAYRKEVIKNIRLYGEMHRFIPAFAAWLGVRVDEVVVTHHPRGAGASKYGLSRVMRVILDFAIVRFFADYMTKPIQFFGKIAIFFILCGIVLCFGLLSGMLVFGWSINMNTFLLVILFSSLLAFQGVALGLIAEIHVRTYFELQDKDPYVIGRVIAPPCNNPSDTCLARIGGERR